MKTINITLKDIPQPIHAALKQRAKKHGRSLNKEALACLEMIVAPKIKSGY
jgi:plasmid stability protein